MKKTLKNTLILALIAFTYIKCDNTKDNGTGTSDVLTVPKLIYPLNNATNIKTDTSFIWNKVNILSNITVKYSIYLSTVNPPVDKISTSKTDTIFNPSLVSNTKYYWKIVAEDGNGNVLESEVRSFKTITSNGGGVSNVLTAPILISPLNNASNIKLDTTLLWNKVTISGNTSVKYTVYLSTVNPPVDKVSTSQGDTLFKPKLALNTTYYWKVSAEDGAGGVKESEVRSFKTLSPPSEPVLTSPANNSTNVRLTSNLTWSTSTSSSGGTIKYNVYLSTSSNPTTKVSTLQSGTSFTPTLVINTTYYWKIEADDGNGGVSMSEVKNFETSRRPTSPILTSPQNNAFNIKLDAVLNWKESIDVDGDALKYNVYFGTENPPTTRVSTVETSYTPTIKSNTRYYWKIEADDGNGGVSESEVWNFKTLTTSSAEFTSDGFSFVSVESGTFTMGCTAEQGTDCYDSEKPSHTVTLSAYSIGKYEVTQAQWVSVMGSNPSYFQSSNGQTACNDCPVETVSWDDIQSFLTTLNNKTGKSYRLPTEAEWEYAARGGKKSAGYKYSGSNNVGSVAWYYDNSSNKTHSIGTKSANELGIYDMNGNVIEWCSDWYDSYTSTSQRNPTGPSSGTYRVLRGGSWRSNAVGARVSTRGNGNPDDRYDGYGFRLLLP